MECSRTRQRRRRAKHQAGDGSTGMESSRRVPKSVLLYYDGLERPDHWSSTCMVCTYMWGIIIHLDHMERDQDTRAKGTSCQAKPSQSSAPLHEFSERHFMRRIVQPTVESDTCPITLVGPEKEATFVPTHPSVLQSILRDAGLPLFSTGAKPGSGLPVGQR